ncbi:hypothetical protein SBA7_30014 [Candidatus Sulfotelmatobacter sp. SbA7]|nr:hypothetical protein SBA7_30014 [Candidatus Sulfotelmatobacter sp. SbA7]
MGPSLKVLHKCCTLCSKRTSLKKMESATHDSKSFPVF